MKESAKNASFVLKTHFNHSNLENDDNQKEKQAYFLHEILSKMRIDKGHPHTFTVNKIRQFLNGHGFGVITCGNRKG